MSELDYITNSITNYTIPTGGTGKYTISMQIINDLVNPGGGEVPSIVIKRALLLE